MRKRCQAFSLIELLVVIALLLVLSALAIGRYDDLTKNQSRLFAQSQLLALMGHAESRFQEQQSYRNFTLGNDALTSKLRERYVVTLTTTTTTLTLTARPHGAQAGDGALTLNNFGEQRHYTADTVTGGYGPW